MNKTQEMPAPLRVCYFGTYRAEYSRNRIMIEGLRRAGVEVIECQEQLWTGIADRVETASGGWLRPGFWWRLGKAYLRLIKKHNQIAEYDVMVVGYPGQLDVFLARLLTRQRRKKLVWDVFMSIYLIAVERGLEEHSRISIRLLKWLEGRALRSPNLLIQDTAQYVSWFHETYGISADRFRLIPTGADDRVFKPLEQAELRREPDTFRVIYYGTFIPNHGVETIVEAANLLQDRPEIQVELIGTGPDLEKTRLLAAKYGLDNLTFIDWLDQEDLVSRVAGADVLLGAFGITPQSMMTVQNKIFEGLAMGKAVITGDSPAIRQALVDREQVYLCTRADPLALSEAIRELVVDPSLRQSLAENGYQAFVEKYSPTSLGNQFVDHLRALP